MEETSSITQPADSEQPQTTQRQTAPATTSSSTPQSAASDQPLPPPQTTQRRTATTTYYSTPQPANSDQPLPPPQITQRRTATATSSTASASPTLLPQSQQTNNSQTTPQLNTDWLGPGTYTHYIVSEGKQRTATTTSSSIAYASSSLSPLTTIDISFLNPKPRSSPSASTSSSVSAPPPPRGGVPLYFDFIGTSPSAPRSSSVDRRPPASFFPLTPASYARQSQIRQPALGMGITIALGSTSSMRPAGVPPNQFRLSESSPTPSHIQSPAAQNVQGHGKVRGFMPGSPWSPSSSQSSHLHDQSWLSYGTKGRPPLPTTTHMSMSSHQPFQQRPYIPQQNHPYMPTTPQQHPIGSIQQSQQQSGQVQEHFSQQYPGSGVQQSITHQQEISKLRGTVAQVKENVSQEFRAAEIQQSISDHEQIHRTRELGIQGPLTPGLKLSIEPLFKALGKHFSGMDPEDCSSRIISKHRTQELINQIDPSVKLDPEAEDNIVNAAEDYVKKIITAGCSSAKGRKSSSVELQDIRAILESDQNPEFGGDETRPRKKRVNKPTRGRGKKPASRSPPPPPPKS